MQRKFKIRQGVLGLLVVAILGFVGYTNNPVVHQQAACSRSAPNATVSWADHYTGLIQFKWNTVGGCFETQYWTLSQLYYVRPGSCVEPYSRRLCGGGGGGSW